LQIVGQLPKYAMEVLAAGLILVLAVMLTTTAGMPLEDVAPTLALYAFAAQRLLPFLQELYAGASSLRSNIVVVDAVYEDMASIPPASDAGSPTSSRAPMPFERELRLEGVTYTYPNADKPAIQDVSISIPHRSFVAFVGATGAGKTTLVDVIVGLLEVDKGVLLVDDTPLDPANMRSWQDNIGYVPQDIYLADDTVAANIAFGIPPEERSNEAIEKAARIANIHDFISLELLDGYETFVGERGVRLSGGQRQRIGIARALYHDPDILVLDEATSALDQGTERDVYEAIVQVTGAKTVILIAHRLVTTRRCDVLFLLEHGRLVAQGTYEALLAGNFRFQSMAGVGATGPSGA
jgi:ABC-type multidrug transport system fused ATPase/permease subunit